MSENAGDSVDRDNGGTGGGELGGGTARSAAKTRGRNFTLKEQFALIDAYVRIAIDSSVGGQQKAEIFTQRIRAEFLKNDRCPPRSEFDSWSERD
jgi:hypothetical protein